MINAQRCELWLEMWIFSSCTTWTQRDGWSWEVELVKNSLAEFRNFWILDQFWINTAAAVQIVTDCRNKTFTTLILQLWMEFFLKFYQIHCGWKYVWNQRRRWEVSSSKLGGSVIWFLVTKTWPRTREALVQVIISLTGLRSVSSSWLVCTPVCLLP